MQSKELRFADRQCIKRMLHCEAQSSSYPFPRTLDEITRQREKRAEFIIKSYSMTFVNNKG